MLIYLQRWFGELLIDIGRKLVYNSRAREYSVITKTHGRNRYEW